MYQPSYRFCASVTIRNRTNTKSPAYGDKSIRALYQLVPPDPVTANSELQLFPSSLDTSTYPKSLPCSNAYRCQKLR